MAEKEAPAEHEIKPLQAFLNSGWRNIYGTLNGVEKRALWRSVIECITVDIARKEFTINFIH